MGHWIILDLEWNTATRGVTVDPVLADRMMFEIIEIGAVRLDDKLEITGRFQRHVKPVLYTKIQRHIAKVTQRTQQSLDEGVLFPEAFSDLMAFAGADPILASWGSSDPEVLISNMLFHGLEEASFRAANVQAIFSAIAEGTRRGNQRSIEYALDYLRLAKDLPFHEALSDAVYAGRILKETLLPKEGDPEDLSRLSAFIYDPFLNRQSDKRLDYDKREEVLSVLERDKQTCPACGREITGHWQEINPGKSWFKAGSCPRHGDIELTAKKARRSKTPSLQIRIRIPQGPLVIPQPAPEKEELVWQDSRN